MKRTSTATAFVVNFSKDDSVDFCWFVRHPNIDDGKPTPINRGDLEAFLNKQKKKYKKGGSK